MPWSCGTRWASRPSSGWTPTTSPSCSPGPGVPRDGGLPLGRLATACRTPQIAVPRVSAPTIKIGLLDESGVGLSPALQWQFLTLLSRPDHLSLLHLDVGLTGRGLFTGLGLTLTPFVDVGLSPRLDGRAPAPTSPSTSSTI